MTNARPEPAIYKLPECSQLHLGQYYATDSTQLTIDSCPGHLLTIVSTLRSSLPDDENSWTAFMMNHAMKITMTFGLLATGIYQYYRITGERKAKAEKAGGAPGATAGPRGAR